MKTIVKAELKPKANRKRNPTHKEKKIQVKNNL